MFIRWRKVQLAQKKNDFAEKLSGEKIPVIRYSLRCLLIETYRNEDKQPRQSSIYLAAILESEVQKTWRRQRFWCGVETGLKRANLSAEEEKKIVQQINERVPRPTKEEVRSIVTILTRR